MNNTIQLTEEQTASLQAGEPITIQPSNMKPIQWGPSTGQFAIYATGDIACSDSSHHRARFGTERKTKEQAKSARDEMRVFNRLLAYRDEFNPDFMFNDKACNYYVYTNGQGKYYINSHSSCSNIVNVYMSKHVAENLAIKLNSGEVVL